MLKLLLDPYRRHAYPDPPDFSLTSEPGRAAREHLELLHVIRARNDRSTRNIGRLIYWIMFLVGVVVLFDVLQLAIAVAFAG